MREGLVRVRRHAEVLEAQHGLVLVEDPHDALLAPDGGGRGDPNVGVLAVHLGGELTVLWASPLDDVHARHDLDAAHEPHPHGGGQHQDLFQRAVDAEAHPDDVLGRLDVHVRGPVTLRLGQDPGDDLHDGCVVGDDLGLGGVGGPPFFRVPSTASKASTRWSTPPMAR